MSIIRVEKTKGFSVIKNTILNDTRLSYRAIGIAAHLLSKPDDWQIHYQYLWKNGVEGRDAVLNAMKELEDFGYLVRIKTQDGRGRWTTSLILREDPDKVFADSPTPGKPAVGKPGAITDHSELSILNHSGQNGVDTPSERIPLLGDGCLSFSPDGLDEKEEEEEEEDKPATKEHSTNVPYTINLNVAGELIEYQTFSPKFRNEVERQRWVKFVEDHFTSMTDPEKKQYLAYMTQNKTIYDKAREHVRVVSWVLYNFGAELYEMQSHSKYFWWRGCSDIYNLCEGDFKLLIYLVVSALDEGKGEGFTLDNPASFHAYMKKDMVDVKEIKGYGLFEEICQCVLTRYDIKLD